MKQQHALIDALIANGIELVTASPGSEWVGVLDALAAAQAADPAAAPRYVNCRHETVAVGLAYGYARATGKTAAVLLHSAVGPLHAAMAIRASYHGKAPLLLLCGDAITSDFSGRDDNGGWIWISRLADTQSSAEFVRGYVKWSTQATSATALTDAVSRGVTLAQELPQGPAFIGVPCSLLLDEMPAPEVPASRYATPETPTPDLSEAAVTLAAAKHPVIIAEYAGRNLGSITALTDIAESLGAAVYDGVDPLYINFPQDHSLYQGARPEKALAAADVILCAGVTTPWFPPSAHVRPETRVIMVDDDIDKSRLPHWDYQIQERIPGDIARNLGALAAALKKTLTADDPQRRNREERRAALAAAHDKMRQGWQQELATARQESALNAAALLAEMREVLSEDTLIIDETVSQSGLVRRWLARPGAYAKVGSGGLGIGVGYALGAKLAQPERPVAFIVGDGTFTYNPMPAGLGASAEYGLPLLTVVLDNQGYAAIRGAYRRYRPKGWAAQHEDYPGVDFKPRPDYAAMAAGFETDGYRINRLDDVTPAFREALAGLARGRGAVIDVKL